MQYKAARGIAWVAAPPRSIVVAVRVETANFLYKYMYTTHTYTRRMEVEGGTSIHFYMLIKHRLHYIFFMRHD